MLSRGESILYSPSQTENVPTLVEDGDSPLQSTLTVAQIHVNMSKWIVRVQYPSWFKEGLRDSIMYRPSGLFI